MINELNNPYKNFTTPKIIFSSPSPEKRQDNKKQSKFDMIYSVPPLTGALAGIDASFIYKEKQNEQMARSIKNFEKGLNSGFDTLPVVQQINDMIKKSKEEIAEAEAHNIRIKNAGRTIDSIDTINADIIKTNNSIIEKQTNFINSLNEKLMEYRKKVVDNQLQKHIEEVTDITKKQIKKFSIGIIFGLTVAGLAISCIINKIKNKNKGV